MLLGIQHYQWCVGSHAGYCDLQPMSEITDTAGSTVLDKLLDGHLCFVTVQVVIMEKSHHIYILMNVNDH